MNDFEIVVTNVFEVCSEVKIYVGFIAELVCIFVKEIIVVSYLISLKTRLDLKGTTKRLRCKVD